MIFAPEHNQEEVRLKELQALNILDTSPDVRYDIITDFAASILYAPVSYIGFIDSDRQWIKSISGVDLNSRESNRDISICAHAICEITSKLPEERIYEIPNLKLDVRFHDNPHVIGPPYIHSYLSYILQSSSGKNIGTFGITDSKERTFTKADYEKVIFLGNMVENLIHGRDILCGIISDAH